MPEPTAFQLREDEAYASINWLDWFGESSIEEALESLRAVFPAKPFRPAATGKLAVLPVAIIKEAGRTLHTPCDLSLRHKPEYSDPSHSGICDYPQDDFDVAREIALCVRDEHLYPARADTNP